MNDWMRRLKGVNTAARSVLIFDKFLQAVKRGRERLQGKDEPAEVG